MEFNNPLIRGLKSIYDNTFGAIGRGIASQVGKAANVLPNGVQKYVADSHDNSKYIFGAVGLLVAVSTGSIALTVLSYIGYRLYKTTSEQCQKKVEQRFIESMRRTRTQAAAQSIANDTSGPGLKNAPPLRAGFRKAVAPKAAVTDKPAATPGLKPTPHKPPGT